MLKSIIIDDDRAISLYIEQLILQTDFISNEKSFTDSTQAAMYLIENKDINLIFLDIEMPKMSGLDIMHNLKEELKDKFIVVISSKERYAIDAINNNVSAYILKPITQANFLTAVIKIQKLAHEKLICSMPTANNETFFVKTTGNKYIKFSADDIFWIEVNRNNIIINTFDNSYTLLATLKEICEKLDENKFIKTHRSFVVNIDKIKQIDIQDVIIVTQDKENKIPISKNYRAELLEKINIL